MTPGLHTALKPSHEPVVVARKPLSGTVAATVLQHGTGALNVDGCRIEACGETIDREDEFETTTAAHDGYIRPGASKFTHKPKQRSGPAQIAGRWPANVVLDPDAARLLDEQAPNTGGGGFNGSGGAFGLGSVYGDTPTTDGARATGRIDANGGASRFFYCAKSSSAERSVGLPDGQRSTHPTVKPIELMRWLVRLVTPPGGLVLDPFAGSGTTGIAAVLERVSFVGVERDPEYAAIARARIGWWAQHPDGMDIVKALEGDRARRAVADTGQTSLFDTTPTTKDEEAA